MDLLLDTHALIWFINGDQSISRSAKNLIEDDDNNIFVSIASLWEFTIKLNLGKLTFKGGIKRFSELIHVNGFNILPITESHIIMLDSLDFIHRDPFDRILISQSKSERMTLLTKDKWIQKYDIETFW